jgi:hypothetical protein
MRGTTLCRTDSLYIIPTGEHSGKLGQSLPQHLVLETKAIQLQDGTFLEWLTRHVYLVVTLWMGYAIISAHHNRLDSLNKITLQFYSISSAISFIRLWIRCTLKRKSVFPDRSVFHNSKALRGYATTLNILSN